MGHHPTRFWHRLEDGRIQCDLCPRLCKLREGQRGLCFVRAAEGGEIVLTTYGRSSGFCIDPIEKKPLYHFLPGSSVLSFGTAGCNLTCKFCQNWDISKSRQNDILAAEAAPETIANAAAATGCSSVAFTYNDPVIFHEYALDAAAACHARGIRTVAVSAGYVCAEPRAEFYRHMDAVNIDLKAFDEDFYRRMASGHLEPVKETLAYIAHETSCWLEITTLLIPGENDSPPELAALCDWVVEALGPDVPLHFSAYQPAWKYGEAPRTPPATLYRARSTALAAGLNHVYTGNISDSARESSICAVCGSRVIGRDRYRITSWNLDETGACRDCGTPLPGVIGAAPGHWGAGYRRIRIEDFAGSGTNASPRH